MKYLASYTVRLRKKLIVLMTSLAVIFSYLAPVPQALAAITANSAQGLVLSAPQQTIKASSAPAAVLGLNAVQSASETLSSIRVILSPASGFMLSDLAALAADATSGIALYKDEGAGVNGAFDGSDSVVALSGAPAAIAVNRFSKITPTATATVSDADMAIAAGDIVLSNITGNGDNIGSYNWHMATASATGVNAAGLRLDGAGAAPTYAASSRFSKLTPAGTTVGNGAAADGTLAVAAGDLVFAKRATESIYGWHMVTAGTTLSDDAGENDAALDGAASDPAAAVTTRYSKLAPAGTVTDNGATSDGMLAVALGDLVFAKVGPMYGWHVVTTAGNLSSDAAENTAFIDGAAADPAIAASSQISKLSTSGGTFQIATAPTADASLAIAAGDIGFGQITKNPQFSAVNWVMATAGAVGVNAAALRLNDSPGAPAFGWAVTLTTAAGQAVPADNSGANAGNDYFVVARTSSSAQTGRGFSFGINPSDVTYSENTPVNSPAPVVGAMLLIDTVAPTLDGSRTGPMSGAVNVPISTSIHFSFNENLDQTTLNPGNVTLTTGGTPVAASVKPFPDGFDLTVSGPPTYDAGSRFAKASAVSTAFFMMMGSNPIAPQGGYTAPTLGDIVIFQHDSFPPEVGLVTDATLTSGTFRVNGFPLFGGQQITKFAAPAATDAVSGATPVTTGDIIVMNSTDNPAADRYNWHMVTAGAAINDAGLRVDGAGAAPAFVSGSRFSSIAPTATATDNGAAGGGLLAVSLGDLVFAKVGGGVYGWHLVTAAGNLSSHVDEGTAGLDGAGAAASLVAATSQMSRLSPAAQGAATDTITPFSFGDIVFAKTTANAANSGTYAFHIVTGSAVGASHADIRFDNFAGALNPSTAYIATATTGVKDFAGNPLASNVVLSFTTGATGGTNTTPPFVQSSSPQPGNQSFPTNAPLKVGFSVGMSTAGGAGGANSVLNPANIGLFLDMNGAPGAQITAANAYDSATRTVTVTPESALAASTNMILKIAPTTQSDTGAPMPEFRLYFRTGTGADASKPTVLGIFPAAGATGVSRTPGAISMGFSEDMDASTVNGTNVSISPAVAATVAYNPSSRSANITPSAALAASTVYTVTVTPAVLDLSGNPLDQDQVTGGNQNFTSTFTTGSDTDSTAPQISSCQADNFGVAVTFNEPMKSGAGPNAVDNIANFSLESPTGTTISLGGKTVTYDGAAMTARVFGLSLQTSNAFKVTVSNLAQDLSNNGIDTTGSPARNSCFGSVTSSSFTGGQLGPDGGAEQDPGQFGMNPIRVSPMNRTAGATSNYAIEFPVATSIPLGGSIVLTFPSGFDVTNAAAMTAGTESMRNGDLNGPAAGTVTIASVTPNATARTITVVTGGAATGTNTFVSFELKNIVNSTVPNSSGYTVDIKTRDTPANNNAILQSMTSAGFFLGQAGTRTVTVNVFNDNGAGAGIAGNGAKDGAEPGIAGAVVFLFSPAVGGLNAATDGDGVATFASLADDNYMIGLEPSSVVGGDFILNSAPQQINVTGNLTKNFGLRAAPYVISGTITGPANTDVDVFATSANGFIRRKYNTGGGGSVAYSIPVLGNTSYNVGVGPAMPTSFNQPGSPPPPPPIFTFMPPPPKEIKVALASVTGQNFTLSPTDKTIVGTVTDSAGVGVSHAFIFARPVSESTTASSTIGFGTGGETDTQGNFTLNVVPGIYLVGVFKPGMPSVQDKQITVPNSGANSPVSLAYVLDASTSVTISGKVTDDAGNAIPYAGVSGRKVNSTSDITPMGGGADNFVGGPTDANGNYTLYVGEGTWVVEAFAPEFGKLGAKTITVAAASVTGQDFTAGTLSLGTVTGRATQAAAGIQGVMVRAEGSAGGNMAITDAGGNYTLKLPAGNYVLSCYFPGIGESAPASITVTANQTLANQNCALAAPIVITVNLTDGANPLTGAFVDVRDSSGRGNGTNVSTTSGANAVYIVSVSPGTYTVRAGHPSYGMVGSESNVSTTSTVTFTAMAGSTFSVGGTVSVSGTGLSGAWVSLTGTPSGQTNKIHVGGQTDANGVFSVNVPNGSYKLRADKPGYKSPSEATVTVADANLTGQNVAMTVADRAISGIVTLNGSPVSNAFVDATDGAGGFAVGQTDAIGAYSLSVTAGTWTLRAHSMGYNGGPIPVTVGGSNVAGQTITLSAISGFTVKPEKFETVSPASGGFLTNSDISAAFKLSIPANALGTSANASTVKTQLNTAMPNPATGSILSKNAVSISVTDSAGQPIKNLNDDITVIVPYTEADLPAGVSENNLVLGTWNDATQTYDILSATIDTVNNTLTATVSHLSDFAPLVPTDPTAPATPTGLLAGNPGTGTSLNLSWTAVSGASSYNIYRSTDSGATFPLFLNVSVIAVNITGLNADTTYHFKVSAVNATGNESAATGAVVAATTVNVSGGGGGGAVTTEPAAAATYAAPATALPGSNLPTYDKTAVATAATSIDDDKSLVLAVVAAKCAAGSLIKGSSSTVYYCGKDGKRYVFPNEGVYKTWFTGFDGLVTMTDADLAQMQLGGNVTYRPGIRMVKIQTDPKVYAVEAGGVLRWMTTETLAVKYYGATWNKLIDDVSDAFFANYKMGANITE